MSVCLYVCSLIAREHVQRSRRNFPVAQGRLEVVSGAKVREGFMSMGGGKWRFSFVVAPGGTGHTGEAIGARTGAGGQYAQT